MKVESESEVAQSCPTLSDPMDCSLLGSSIHGNFQTRVLEWVASAFSEFQATKDLTISSKNSWSFKRCLCGVEQENWHTTGLHSVSSYPVFRSLKFSSFFLSLNLLTIRSLPFFLRMTITAIHRILWTWRRQAQRPSTYTGLYTGHTFDCTLDKYWCILDCTLNCILGCTLDYRSV